MATVIANGKQTIKLYQSSNRGKPIFQLAYYLGGRRVLRNFADKSQAKRTANGLLGGTAEDSALVDNLATPELESLVAAKKVLALGYALHVAVEEHAQAVNRLGKASLREAVDYFLAHHCADVPRLMLSDAAELFAASRRQSGLSDHYVGQCKKTVSDLATAFPGKAVTDLRTSDLDTWLGDLPLAPKTKNGMRTIVVAFGNWAENRYLPKGASPFTGMVRYKETKAPVSIFTPDNIGSLLAKADNTLKPFLAIGAFAGLRMAELQRLDWSEVDLDRGFITVAAHKAKTRQRRLVPIAENLKLWLRPYLKPNGPICLHQRPQMAVTRFCDGFKWEANGLRHSYISYRLAVLHDTARVALEAGNSPEVIFMHYRELVTPEEAYAWFNVKPE
jgi:integrase